MGLFGFGKKDNAPAPVATPVSAPAPGLVITGQPGAGKTAPASGGLSLQKQSGAITLEKGNRVLIEKTSVITARCEWSSNTDYDLYALVLMKDGRELVVSTFGSQAQPQPTPSVLNGAVRHLGDVGRGAKGIAEETIEIKLTDEIEAVIPVAYSAQSNGTGSFRKYKVSLGIDNGQGTKVTIDSKNASNNNTIYTVAIGVIRNTADGVVVESLESYSQTGSEHRPAFRNGQLVMDAGSKNLYK
jgi:tellurite resistance protein TerA